MKYRRYELDDGRRTTTVEIPATVLRAFGMTKVRDYMEAWQRGEAQRARAVLLRQRVAEGIKPAAIAHEFGVTEARVRQIRKEYRNA